MAELSHSTSLSRTPERFKDSQRAVTGKGLPLVADVKRMNARSSDPLIFVGRTFNLIRFPPTLPLPFKTVSLLVHYFRLYFLRCVLVLDYPCAMPGILWVFFDVLVERDVEAWHPPIILPERDEESHIVEEVR